MVKKILRFGFRHKIVAAALTIAIIGGGYYGYTAMYGNDSAIRSVFAQAQKGTLIVSVSGSGQVSVSNQVDIKPKVSGDLVFVGVKNGQGVKAGALIAQLDARDAQKSVRDAETALESAKLSLEKLKKPADALSILQAENTLLQAKESKQKAQDNLKKAYEDGFNTVAQAFLDLPTVISGLEDMFFDNTIDRTQNNIDWYVNQTDYQNNERDIALRYRGDVVKAYNKARAAYTKNADHYKLASRSSDSQTVKSLISETYETTKIIADAVKISNNFIDFIQDAMKQHNFTIPSTLPTHQSALDSYTNTTNSHLLNTLAIKRTIEDSEGAITNADRTIAEKNESLVKLKAGADALDIQSQELAIRQRENALLDAKEKLADYVVRAPFDGIIAKADVKKGDSVSSGSILATLITRQKLAEISLNEVDVAKVNVGGKATLTFDAVPDLTITGQVAELDQVGTISQGVVTYMITIAFDTQDDRVKTAMSVSAAIVTEARPHALLVPNSAVKSQGNASYVEMPSEADRALAATATGGGVIFQEPIRRQMIEVGLSNDELTEVTSGLNEGDLVVTRMIQPNAQQSQTPQQSGSIRIPGIGGGGGGFRGGGGGMGH